MTTIRKSLLLITFFCGLLSNAQVKHTQATFTDTDGFSLSLSIFNYAEMIFDGTTTYKLSEGRLTITKRFFLSKADTLLFTKKLDINAIEQLKTIKLDTLKDSYVNWCTMPTSGNEYHILTTYNTITKSIYLHHFYHKKIADLITELNKNIPDKYKINYLTNEPENKCDDIKQVLTFGLPPTSASMCLCQSLNRLKHLGILAQD